MSLLRHITRLLFIDGLIRRNATGSPEQFAEKNRLSKSGLMKVLKDMRELGYPIEYNHTKQSYCYNQKPERSGGMKLLKLSLQNIEGAEILTREELKKTMEELVDYNDLCYSEMHIFERC